MSVAGEARMVLVSGGAFVFGGVCGVFVFVGGIVFGG